MFRIKDEDAVTVDEGKDKEKKEILKKSKEEVAEYIKATTMYVNEFINFLKNIHRQDKEKGHTLQDDVKNFFKKYNGSFTKMMEESSKKSQLLTIMNRCGPKMVAIIFNILKSPGSTGLSNKLFSLNLKQLYLLPIIL